MKPRLPTAEEWKSIQGGAPTLLLSPSKRLVEIIHAYRTPSPDNPYSGPLAVVPTPIKQVVNSEWSRLQVGDKQVQIPNVLLWEYHGHPCEIRSGQGNDGYKHLPSALIDPYIEQRQAEGWQQFGLARPLA